MSSKEQAGDPVDFTAARREVMEFECAHEEEPAHTRHVTALSLQIYDGLNAWHGLGAGERFILEAAASLHDIGWSVVRDGAGHHKVAARMIREHRWKTLSEVQVELIAQVARYHRKSMPIEDHKPYARLNAADQRRVRVLAGILRVGDSLDRRHLQTARTVRVDLQPRRLILNLGGTPPFDVEAAIVRKKGDLLTELLGREIQCVEAV